MQFPSVLWAYEVVWISFRPSEPDTGVQIPIGPLTFFPLMLERTNTTHTYQKKDEIAEQSQIRSVSFDTSFLLKDDSLVETVIHNLAHDRIPCFLTATVASELEQLHVWGRITESTYKKAMKRWTHIHATVIDFKNRLVSDTLGHACLRSMQDHGIDPKHVMNDCTILVSTLKNGLTFSFQRITISPLQSLRRSSMKLKVWPAPNIFTCAIHGYLALIHERFLRRIPRGQLILMS